MLRKFPRNRSNGAPRNGTSRMGRPIDAYEAKRSFFLAEKPNSAPFLAIVAEFRVLSIFIDNRDKIIDILTKLSIISIELSIFINNFDNIIDYFDKSIDIYRLFR